MPGTRPSRRPKWACGAMLASLLLAALPSSAGASPADPLPRAPAEALGMSAERLGRVVPKLKEEVERGRLVGGVLAVARNGKLALYESFGHLDPQARTPMPKDAIFPLGAMTQPLTVAAALMLLDEGRLLLGEPVGRYLPALERREVFDPALAGVARTLAPPAAPGSAPVNLPTVAAKRQPTVLDLMRHTAGFTAGLRGASDLHRAYPASSVAAAESYGSAEFLARLAALPLAHQPGSQWEPGLSVDVLGLAVEAVASRPLDPFLDERLFARLGMADTGFAAPDAKFARLVRPREREPGAWTPGARAAPRFACGGGCAWSTAGDYLRFAQLLANQGQWQGQRLLARKSVEAMTSDQLGPEVNTERLRDNPSLAGYGFGLGVAVRRATGGGAAQPGSAGEFYGHGAQGSMFWVDPKEQLVVVFMAQAPMPQRHYLRQLVSTLVLQALER